MGTRQSGVENTTLKGTHGAEVISAIHSIGRTLNLRLSREPNARTLLLSICGEVWL